jgi:hypothetical protein
MHHDKCDGIIYFVLDLIIQRYLICVHHHQIPRRIMQTQY